MLLLSIVVVLLVILFLHSVFNVLIYLGEYKLVQILFHFKAQLDQFALALRCLALEVTRTAALDAPLLTIPRAIFTVTRNLAT